MKTIENMPDIKSYWSNFKTVRLNELNYNNFYQKFDLNNRFHALVCILNGNGVLSIDYDENVAIEGKYFFIEKNKFWKWEQWENINGIMVLFTDLLYHFLYTGNPNVTSDKMLHADTSFIFLEDKEKFDTNHLFSQIEKESQMKDDRSIEMIVLYLKLLTIIYQKHAGISGHFHVSDRKSQVVNTFKTLVNSDFIKLKTPKDYADKLNITPNYLNGLCKEVMDKTAGEIIRDRIILEARRLLTNTDSTAAEIGFQLGFADSSYFGRYFRKASGVPPEKYRTIFCEK